MNFHEASEKLGNKDRRKLEENTWLVRLDKDRIAVRLHQTNVVILHSNGNYTLASGGERTATTKRRINKYSPVQVFQDRHAWFVNGAVLRGVPFFDGMQVDSRGVFLNNA